MSQAHFRFGALLLAAGLLAVAAGGCGSTGPQTYPVRGKVVFQGGDAAELAGNLVQLQLKSDPTIQGTGTIEDDGSFQVHSIIDGVAKEGVVEGEHQVRIVINVEDDCCGGGCGCCGPSRKRLPINRRYTDFQQSGITWTAPSDKDELVIEVTK